MHVCACATLFLDMPKHLLLYYSDARGQDFYRNAPRVASCPAPVERCSRANERTFVLLLHSEDLSFSGMEILPPLLLSQFPSPKRYTVFPVSFNL